jgi:ABC-2 type transport system permease protein
VPDSSFESQALAPSLTSPTRPFYWSVRREIWENRAIYIAPLAVAGVVICGFMIRVHKLPTTIRTALALEPQKQRAMIVMPFDVAAVLILLTTLIIGAFYCLDALQVERRDRSILFWKSLPVSDVTTVLSKIIIPLVILPVVVFPVILVTQVVMVLLSCMVLAGHGLSPATLLSQLKFFPSSLSLLYGLIVIPLWHAPIYAWFLMASAWARRMAVLWALLPVLALGIAEKIAFNTTHVINLIVYRLFGWFMQAFQTPPDGSFPLDPLAMLTPARYLATPGLWSGLIAAAIFLAVATRLRRYREPN